VMTQLNFQGRGAHICQIDSLKEQQQHLIFYARMLAIKN
jgi:hypothetical protein